MQIRKAADLEKGSEIEFEDGKKGKLSQDDAKKLANMFNTLKRPADKEKFQKVVSKDLRSIKALLKRVR
jgi:cytochrome c